MTKKTIFTAIIMSVVIAIISLTNISLFPPEVSLQEPQKVSAADGDAWYSTGGIWNYRKKITINNNQVADVTNPSTTYANFPILISTTGLSNIKENGSDIRFTMADGITEIPREIESYESGNLEAWVKLTLTKDDGDAIDDNDVIYMYYGNDSATEPAVGSEFGRNNVWDSNFKMVQHMEESDIDGGAGDIKDSTSYGNNGTTSGMDGDDQVAGQIDGSLDFDMTNYVDNGSDENIDDLHTKGGMSISAWINPRTAGASDSGDILNKAVGVSGYWFFSLTNAGLQFRKDGSSSLHVFSVADIVTFNQLQHVVVTWDGSTLGANVHIYLNGEEIVYGWQGNGAELTSDVAEPLRIGTGFDGIIDEVRLSDSARSADWIKTEYNNQNTPGTFAVFGNQTTIPPSCASAEGTCKTNACSIYVDCSSISGICDTGNCCLGACTIDEEAPTIPTNLSATAISTTEINLTWTASTDDVGVIGYKIYRDNMEIDTTTNTTYSDTGLSHSTLYTYTVSAYDAIPNESNQSSSDSATTESPDTTPPANITNLSISSCTKDSCDLSWTSPGDDNNTGTATTYDIRYSTSNITDDNWDSATQEIGESSPQIAGATETHTATELNVGTTYYFAIKTSDEIPNESGLGNVGMSATIETDAIIYYIDYETGDDTNDGLSRATPFKHCPGDANASGNAVATTLNAGDRVIFKGGVQYNTNGTNKNYGIRMTWSGSGDADANRIIYDGDSGTYAARWASGADKAIIDGGGETAMGLFTFLSAGKQYITINNFVIRNGRDVARSSDYFSGLVVSYARSSHITVSNSTLSDAGHDTYDVDRSGFGILGGGDYWKIYNNTITDCYLNGVNIKGSYNKVYNNTFTGKVRWTLTYANTGSADITGTEIYNNIFHNCGKGDYGSASFHQDWIYVFSTETGGINNLKIYNNKFYNDYSPADAFGSGFIYLGPQTTKWRGWRWIVEWNLYP